MAYMTKDEAFAHLRLKNPRGAEAGTSLFYLDSSTKQRVDFKVEAEQVWQIGDTRRVMGLVWSGVCTSCGDGFFQLSATHPEGLNEQCSFCALPRFDTYNVHDTSVFDPEASKTDIRPRVKRRGRYEAYVLQASALFGEESVVEADELIDKTVSLIPPPEDGARDIRRQSVIRAVNSLSREKDGPMQVKGSSVIFYK